MGNLIQYARDFASQSFETTSISDIDILLLTELLYLHFDHIIPTDSQQAISLTSAGKLFLANIEQHRQNNAYLASNHRIELLEASYRSSRFAGVEMSHFVNDINAIEEKQFAAITYRLNHDTYLIVFRGTDDTLVGWKEDFNLSYSDEIPAQIEAMHYLEQVTHTIDGNFYISGHSKGGNLAIYAATKAHYLRERLLGVYSFDAPGFHEHFLQEETFKEIEQRILYYIPQESIVGELLARPHRPIIVKSKQFGLLQHDPKNWEITDGAFVTVDETTSLSTLISETFSRWLNQRDNDELKLLFDTVFSLFHQADITSLNELSDNFWSCIKKLHASLTQLSPELRELINTDLNQMLNIAWTISKEKNIEQYRLWQRHFEEWFNSLKDSTIVQFFSNNEEITLSLSPPSINSSETNKKGKE